MYIKVIMARYSVIRIIVASGMKKRTTIAGIIIRINRIIAGPKVFLSGFLGLKGNCPFVLLVTAVMNDTLF